MPAGAGRLPPARAAGRLRGPAPAPPPPLPPPSALAAPSRPLALLPPAGLRRRRSARAGPPAARSHSVPFVAWSGSGRPRLAELPGARRGSRAATTEQPRDWPPRAPLAAVPFPGALTPFSGWDGSGGADSAAGIAAAEEAAAAAERGSMFSPGQEEHCAPGKEPVKYGELVVLG